MRCVPVLFIVSTDLYLSDLISPIPDCGVADVPSEEGGDVSDHFNYDHPNAFDLADKDAGLGKRG